MRRSDATDMTMTSPLSLAEVKRLAGNADTILLRASRDADLETPVGAFLRMDDGGPAYLLESVEGGERVGRYSFLGVGPRRTLEVRGTTARIVDRPLSEDVFHAALPSETLEVADPIAAIRAFVPRRRVVPLEGMPRFTGGAVGALAYDAISQFEPVPLPETDHIGVPTAAFLETDLVLVFDHLTHTLSAIASLQTRSGRPRGPLPDRRAGPLRGARADGPTLRRRARPDPERPPRRRWLGAHRAREPRSRPASAARPTRRPSSGPRTPSRPARPSRSCSPAASR